MLSLYDKLDAVYSANSSYIERKLFSPVTQMAENDPTRMNSIEEIKFFLDTQQEGRYETLVSQTMNGLTPAELEQFSTVVKSVWEMSGELGVPTITFGTLLRQIYQNRLVNLFLSDMESVLEVGPGSGYLPVLVARSGRKVVSTDVTQALFVTQALLYNYLGYINKPKWGFPFSDEKTVMFESSSFEHLPWWQFRNLIEPGCGQVESIVINCAVCELHKWAVQHLLVVAQNLGVKRFLMDSTGHQTPNRTIQNVAAEFRMHGYEVAHAGEDIFVFDRSDVQLPLPTSIRPAQTNQYGIDDVKSIIFDLTGIREMLPPSETFYSHIKRPGQV